LPFDESELDELELDEESEPDEPDEPDELDESEDEDDEAPTDSVLLADPLDELPAAVLAASRLSLR
jgi:TATA-binding protein-associated factor Taf7